MYYNIFKLYPPFNNHTFNKHRIIRNLKRQLINKAIMNLRKLKYIYIYMVRKLSKRLNSKRLNSKRRSYVKRKKSVKRINISMQKGGVLFNPGDTIYFIVLEQDEGMSR